MSTETLPVPYVSKLEGTGISPGQSVVVRGVMLEDAAFSINLSSGPRKTDGTPFHLSVRPDEKKFVMNSHADGEWGKEEREKLTLEENEKFSIRIRLHDGEFEIFANQKPVGKFEYRTAISNINHLIIDGALELHSINWGGKYYPVPYQAGFDNGFLPGRKLIISGMPEKKPKRFNVNFLTSSGDVAFHFNPRFDEKAVVRNAKVNGEWGNEEREGKFPFDKKGGFEVELVNEEYAFQCHVNGEQFCAFAHRSDPNDITGVQIQGDIELQGVNVR